MLCRRTSSAEGEKKLLEFNKAHLDFTAGDTRVLSRHVPTIVFWSSQVISLKLQFDFEKKGKKAQCGDPLAHPPSFVRLDLGSCFHWLQSFCTNCLCARLLCHSTWTRKSESGTPLRQLAWTRPLLCHSKLQGVPVLMLQPTATQMVDVIGITFQVRECLWGLENFLSPCLVRRCGSWFTWKEKSKK